MATRYTVLSDRRQKSLQGLAKACRGHRNVRAARHAAVRDTLQLLRLELKAKAEAEAKARRADKARSIATPDLFAGLHA